MAQKSLIQKVCEKARLVSKSLEVHQDAYLTHIMNGQKWQRDRSELNNLAFVQSETTWDNVRDTLDTLAIGLHAIADEWLATLPSHEGRAIRRANQQLKHALDAETEAFKAFSAAREDATQKREAYEHARSNVIHKTWPVVENILAMCRVNLTGVGWHATQYFDQVEGLAAKGKPQTPPPPDPLAVKIDPESTIETDLDGTPAHDSEPPVWTSAKTKEEQDYIIYQNRAATLGKKAAGRMIAQERYWAKRRGASAE